MVVIISRNLGEYTLFCQDTGDVDSLTLAVLQNSVRGKPQMRVLIQANGIKRELRLSINNFCNTGEHVPSTAFLLGSTNSSHASSQHQKLCGFIVG